MSSVCRYVEQARAVSLRVSHIVNRLPLGDRLIAGSGTASPLFGPHFKTDSRQIIFRAGKTQAKSFS